MAFIFYRKSRACTGRTDRRTDGLQHLLRPPREGRVMPLITVPLQNLHHSMQQGLPYSTTLDSWNPGRRWWNWTGALIEVNITITINSSTLVKRSRSLSRPTCRRCAMSMLLLELAFNRDDVTVLTAARSSSSAGSSTSWQSHSRHS